MVVFIRWKRNKGFVFSFYENGKREYHDCGFGDIRTAIDYAWLCGRSRICVKTFRNA
jgi:hypothetical protein